MRSTVDGGDNEKGRLTLLDGTQFLLKIDVERGSCHLFLYDKKLETET